MTATTTVPSRNMAPRVHLVRHAQGLHNVSAANHMIVDPILTAYGRRQCSKVAAGWPAEYTIALLAASPLRRTLDTARLSFPAHAHNILAVPDAQEVGTWPCDAGSPLATLETEFAPLGVDLSLVSEGWEKKAGRYARELEALQTRARDLRCWLREKSVELQDRGDVVLVTHGAFLHFLTQDWSDYDRVLGTGWTNTEYRSYNFADLVDPEAPMVETEQSRLARGQNPKPDRTEFAKLQKLKFAQHRTSLVTVNANGRHLPDNQAKTADAGEEEWAKI